MGFQASNRSMAKPFRDRRRRPGPCVRARVCISVPFALLTGFPAYDQRCGRFHPAHPCCLRTAKHEAAGFKYPRSCLAKRPQVTSWRSLWSHWLAWYQPSPHSWARRYLRFDQAFSSEGAMVSMGPEGPIMRYLFTGGTLLCGAARALRLSPRVRLARSPSRARRGGLSFHRRPYRFPFCFRLTEIEVAPNSTWPRVLPRSPSALPAWRYPAVAAETRALALAKSLDFVLAMNPPAWANATSGSSVWLVSWSNDWSVLICKNGFYLRSLEIFYLRCREALEVSSGCKDCSGSLGKCRDMASRVNLAKKSFCFPIERSIAFSPLYYIIFSLLVII